MKTKTEDFEVLVPNLDGTGIAERVPVKIPLEWDEEMQQWLLTPEAHRIIEDTKARHMGLLLPAQFRELRERYGFSQREMGELFQAGEKSWTRWETGKHRPSRMVSLLIRALYDGAISINYLLEKAGKPPISTETERMDQILKDLLKKWLSSAVSTPRLTAAPTVKASFLTDLQNAQPQAIQKLSRCRVSPRSAPSHAYAQPRFSTFEIPDEGTTEA